MRTELPIWPSAYLLYVEECFEVGVINNLREDVDQIQPDPVLLVIAIPHVAEHIVDPSFMDPQGMRFDGHSVRQTPRRYLTIASLHQLAGVSSV